MSTDSENQNGSPADDGLAFVVAPGCQGHLFVGVPAVRVRWRVVRRDGTRFPEVAELGVIIAQVKTLAQADGVGWVVGSDEHTIEVRRRQDDSAGPVEVIGVGPRWSRTVAAALQR
jgi:hypothetical protein